MILHYQVIPGPTWLLLSHQIGIKIATDANRIFTLLNISTKIKEYARKVSGENKGTETSLTSTSKKDTEK